MSGTKRLDRKRRRIANRVRKQKIRKTSVTVEIVKMDGTVKRVKAPLIGRIVVSDSKQIFEQPGTYRKTIEKAIGGDIGKVRSARIILGGNDVNG